MAAKKLPKNGDRLWRTGGLGFQAKGVPIMGPEMIYYNNVGFEAGPLPRPASFESILKDYDRDGGKQISEPEFSRHPEFGQRQVVSDIAMFGCCHHANCLPVDHP